MRRKTFRGNLTPSQDKTMLAHQTAHGAKCTPDAFRYADLTIRLRELGTTRSYAGPQEHLQTGDPGRSRTPSMRV